MRHPIRFQGQRPRAIAAAVVLALALATAAHAGAGERAPVPAGALAVTNCEDSGSGSFRDAVTHAVDGDTIDLTQLDCSAITLTTGEVLAAAASLTIEGPGADRLTISAGNNGRVIDHIGSGLLTISDVSIADGFKYAQDGDIGTPKGGCVFSQGSVSLANADVAHCYLRSTSTSDGARGGAIYARYVLTVSRTSITHNAAQSFSGTAYGGGLYAGDEIFLDHSTVASNRVTAVGHPARGGGVHAGSIARGCSGVTVTTSEIDDNIALGSWGTGGGVYTTCSTLIGASAIIGNNAAIGGGVIVQNNGATAQGVLVVDSTIAFNGATVRGSGIVLGNELDPAAIESSTIASNAQTSAMLYGAGVEIASGTTTVDLESVIISGNSTDIGQGPVPDDLGGFIGSGVTGANDLVFAPSLATPSDTLIGVDPQLEPPAYDGGPTKTLAILGSSPARDRGNNVAGLSVDQRGAPRIVGLAADIGAFELGDLIFFSEFENVP